MKHSYAYSVEKEHPWGDGFSAKESFLALQLFIATEPLKAFQLGDCESIRFHKDNNCYIITAYKLNL
jgi:hypothetical protein